MFKNFAFCLLALTLILTPFITVDTAVASDAVPADESVLLDGGTCDLPVSERIDAPVVAPADILDEEPEAMCGTTCINACYAEWTACVGTCDGDSECRRDCRDALQDCKGACPIFCG